MGNKYEIQSVMIDKNIYSLSEAKAIIRRKGHLLSFGGKKYDETPNFYRFRQRRPTLYKSFFIKKSAQDKGVMYVIGVR